MSDYNLRTCLTSFLIPLLFTISFCQTSFGQRAVSSDTDTEWGVRSTAIKTESGTLTVYMPDDAALGDTISGTVVVEPNGETAQERQANMDTLEGYVVDTENVSSRVVEVEPEDTSGATPQSKKVVTLEIPATVTGEIIDLVLKDPKGDQVTKIDFPVSPPSSYTPPSVPDKSDFKLPDIGQAGRPIEMTGPFDGEVVNTDVKIGGKNAKVLAQSPRKTVAESPRDLIGPTDIELTEGNVTVKDQYRNVALGLSAEKLTLMRGERTTLKVKILGLQGLEEEIPFNLENRSPSVVTIEGGDSQTVTVGPAEVGSDGTYTINKTLTGIRPGPFSISARISPERTTVPGEHDSGIPGEGIGAAEQPGQDGVVEISDEACACENMQVKLDKKIESESYRENFEVEKNEGGHVVKVTKTRTVMAVPYKYKTKCSGGEQTDDCVAGLSLDLERDNWDGKEPESEEVHNGKSGEDKISYFKKTKGGDPEIKNIDCTRKCPRNRGWSGWNTGTLYYEAVFGELDNSLNESLKFKLTTKNCGTERKDSKSYDIYGCECNKIRLILPGAKKEVGGTFFILGDNGVILNQEPGTRLKIPYEYSIDCTGHSSADCNAQIEVEAKPVNWTVHWVTKDGNTVRTRSQEVNSATVEITQPSAVTCSGKCGRRGKTSEGSNMELSFGIKVKGQQNVDRHEGQLELSFKHKYCNDFKVVDKSGSNGEVIGKLKIDVDLKSDEWKELVKD